MVKCCYGTFTTAPSTQYPGASRKLAPYADNEVDLRPVKHMMESIGSRDGITVVNLSHIIRMGKPWPNFFNNCSVLEVFGRCVKGLAPHRYLIVSNLFQSL